MTERRAWWNKKSEDMKRPWMTFSLTLVGVFVMYVGARLVFGDALLRSVVCGVIFTTLLGCVNGFFLHRRLRKAGRAKEPW